MTQPYPLSGFGYAETGAVRYVGITLRPTDTIIAQQYVCGNLSLELPKRMTPRRKQSGKHTTPAEARWHIN